MSSKPRVGGNIYRESHGLCYDPCPEPCDPCTTGGGYGGVAAVIVVILVILVILFIIFRQRTTATATVPDCKANTPINVVATSSANKTVNVTWDAVVPAVSGNAVEYTVFVSPVKNFGSTDAGVQIIKTPNTTATFGGVNFTPAFVKVQANEGECEPSDLSQEVSVAVECTVVIPDAGINFQVTKIGNNITEGEFTHVEGAKSYHIEMWRSEGVGPALNERHIFFSEDDIPVPDGTAAGATLAFDFDPFLDTAGGEQYHILIHGVNECGKSRRSDNVFAI